MTSTHYHYKTDNYLHGETRGTFLFTWRDKRDVSFYMERQEGRFFFGNKVLYLKKNRDIGSEKGNISITAGDKVNSAGTTFISGNDLNITGKDVTIDNTINTEKHGDRDIVSGKEKRN